jgi:hypothetical protein
MPKGNQNFRLIIKNKNTAACWQQATDGAAELTGWQSCGRAACVATQHLVCPCHVALNRAGGHCNLDETHRTRLDTCLFVDGAGCCRGGDAR